MSVEFPLEIDCQSTAAQLPNGNLLLLDCRQPEEFATAKIAGATLIPMSELPQRLAELEQHREGRVIVHCHHGGRSLRVAQWLREQGFPQAQSMAGGIDEWSREIDPSVPRY